MCIEARDTNAELKLSGAMFVQMSGRAKTFFCTYLRMCGRRTMPKETLYNEDRGKYDPFSKAHHAFGEATIGEKRHLTRQRANSPIPVPMYGRVLPHSDPCGAQR